MVNPYKDQPLTENTFYRTFSHDTNETELVWHRDKKSRSIQVVEGTGWYLQNDNELPTFLETNETYYISAEDYHRIIKSPGADRLVLKITELDH